MPDRELDHPDWVDAGRKLGAMSRVSNWWIGDWLQYGELKWGEKYVEAARITGYDVKTLRNISYVARRFHLSRRRDTLTWSHHAELATLPDPEQDRWLDRAVADRLSVADLRVELRAVQRGGNSSAERNDEDPGGPPDGSVVCPHCGGTVPLPARSLRRRERCAVIDAA